MRPNSKMVLPIVKMVTPQPKMVTPPGTILNTMSHFCLNPPPEPTTSRNNYTTTRNNCTTSKLTIYENLLHSMKIYNQPLKRSIRPNFSGGTTSHPLPPNHQLSMKIYNFLWHSNYQHQPNHPTLSPSTLYPTLLKPTIQLTKLKTSTLALTLSY